jgi:hypothetical protein
VRDPVDVYEQGVPNSSWQRSILCLLLASTGLIWLLLVVQQRWFVVCDRQCVCHDSSGLRTIYFKRIDGWEGSSVAGILCMACACVLYAQVGQRSGRLLYVAAICSSMAFVAQLLDGPDSLLPVRLRFDPGASIGLALSVVQTAAAAWALWVCRIGKWD